MSDPKPQAEETETKQETPPSPWDAVIKDFQSLGQSITEAVQEAVQDEKHKESLNELRQGLEGVANQVAKSVEDAAHSAQAEQVKSGVQRAVGDVRAMGGKVYSDTKPALINALEGLSAGIQKMIERLQEPEAAPPAEAEAADAETAQTADA